jgi:hypothetical protein
MNSVTYLHNSTSKEKAILRAPFVLHLGGNIVDLVEFDRISTEGISNKLRTNI